jgi:glycosyltransferase 2 family protein
VSPNRLTRTTWFVLRIALGFGLLAYVLSRTGGWTQAARLFAVPWLLPAFVLFTLIGAAVEAKRLCLLLRSQARDLPFGASLALVAVSVFFGLCIPGGTGGDLIKLYYLARDDRSRGIEMATVILVDRAVGLFSMLALAVILGLVHWRLLLAPGPVPVLTAGALAGMLLVMGLALLSWSTSVRSMPLVEWLRTRAPLHRYLGRGFDALHAFKDHRGAVLQAVSLSLLGQVALAGAFAAAGTVLVPGCPVLLTPFLSLLGMVANWIPLTPGGLGVGEAAFAGLFHLSGFAGGETLLLAWRIGMLPIAAIGAALYAFGPSALKGSPSSGPASAT